MKFGSEDKNGLGMAEFKIIDPDSKPDLVRHNFTNAIQKSS